MKTKYSCTLQTFNPIEIVVTLESEEDAKCWLNLVSDPARVASATLSNRVPIKTMQKFVDDLCPQDNYGAISRTID